MKHLTFFGKSAHKEEKKQFKELEHKKDYVYVAQVTGEDKKSLVQCYCSQFDCIKYDYSVYSADDTGASTSIDVYDETKTCFIDDETAYDGDIWIITTTYDEMADALNKFHIHVPNNIKTYNLK